MARPALTHDDIARLPLERFAALGLVVEIAVPWAKRTLFLVSGPASLAALQPRGISRGRVWTATEVLDLLAAGVTPAEAVKIAGTKVQFAASLTGVRPDEQPVHTAPTAPRASTQLALPIGVTA